MAIYKEHGIDAEIDDEMLPLVRALNDLGLHTVSCCSGHGHRKAQIAFKIEDVDILVSKGITSINWALRATRNKGDSTVP